MGPSVQHVELLRPTQGTGTTRSLARPRDLRHSESCGALPLWLGIFTRVPEVCMGGMSLPTKTPRRRLRLCAKLEAVWLPGGACQRCSQDLCPHTAHPEYFWTADGIVRPHPYGN